MNRFDNIDCMLGMAEYEDNHFNLAIVDPPYGEGNNIYSFEINLKIKDTKHDIKGWNDNKPKQNYFNELYRVSKNQIIWGGNYFVDYLPSSRGWIFWDKLYEKMHSFADGELAFSSFDMNLKKYTFRGNLTKAIHPTQKPISLYKWLLTKYAKEGNLILDTHVGSASSLIACEDMGFEYVGFELDEDYYNAAQKRLAQFRSQYKLALKC